MRPRIPPPGFLSRAPSFARLLTARGVSLLGDGIGNLALVVHVQQTRGTGTAVGLLLLVASLPRVLSPWAGTVADRVDQRTVLVAGEVAQAALIGAAALWLPPLPVLLALLLGKATVATVAEPAGLGAVPALVDDADLATANSLIGGLREAGELLGPLIGGVLVAAAGVRAGLAVDALTFIVSVPLLLRVRSLPPEPPDAGAARTGMGSAAWEGLRYTAGHPVARAVALGFFLLGFSSGDDVALPFLARTLDSGAAGIGGLYAAVGGGLILGYVLLARVGRRIPAARGFLLGAAVAAMGNLATGLAPSLLAAVAFQMTRGVGVAVLETNMQTLIQRNVPRRLVGRVFANIYGAVNVTAALGLLAGGALLDATSARTVLVTVGGVGLAGAGLSTILLTASRLPAGPQTGP